MRRARRKNAFQHAYASGLESDLFNPAAHRGGVADALLGRNRAGLRGQLQEACLESLQPPHGNRTATEDGFTYRGH
jgi:hypothetical protein